MNHPSIIETIHLFPKIDQLLISLLKQLKKADWEKQTLASKWKVKDVAAHLLDGNIRTVSLLRDQYSLNAPAGISSYRDLVDYLDELNADWVNAMKRMSPELMIHLLEVTGKMYCEVMQSQDLHAEAIYAVSWAGEERSANWFHIAREYTEKWHHQQQIRHAVDDTGPLFSQEFYHPFLDTCMRALPYHYRSINSQVSTCIQFDVEGSGSWWLIRKDDHWELFSSPHHQPQCTVRIPGEIAWRVLTKGISHDEAEGKTEILGERPLGIHFLGMLSVMA